MQNTHLQSQVESLFFLTIVVQIEKYQFLFVLYHLQHFCGEKNYYCQ